MLIVLIFSLFKSTSSPFFFYIYYHLKVLKWLSSPSFILSLSIGTPPLFFYRLSLVSHWLTQLSVKRLARDVKPWPPASRGIVCAWGLYPAFWCYRSAGRPWWRSDGAEGGSLAACLPAEGPLDAGSPQSPAEPHEENPGVFGRPQHSLYAWSLEQGQRRGQEEGLSC